MSTTSTKADTVIRNANVITMDARRPRAQAVAVSNGRIIGVGRNEDVETFIGPGVKVMDLTGSTVLPGFNDAHIHVLNSGIRHVMAADCDLPTIAAIQTALRDRAETTPPGQWVQGFKYDDTKTAENRSIFREELDAVSAFHPIMVSHRAGHIYYLNSMALELAGFDRDTPDPFGGRLGRDPDTGELNGVVYERAIEHVRFGLIPSDTPEIRREGLRTICRMLTEAGLTSVHDARVVRDEFVTYQEGRDAGDLSLRVYALMYHPHFRSLQEAGLKTGLRRRYAAPRRNQDGGRRGYRRPHRLPVGALCRQRLRPRHPGHERRGNRGKRDGDAPGRVPGVHPRQRRPGHRHGAERLRQSSGRFSLAPTPGTASNTALWSIPDILGKMRRLGTIATPFCTYVYHHGEKMPFYGEERLQWMFAQRSFLDYGVVGTGATDYPPGPFEPLLGIQSCVTRTDSRGNVWGPDQKVTVEEALRIYTRHSAYASFEEDEKGAVEVGKLADLVVLGSDPTAIDPFGIKDIQVERTIVGGRTVYEA